jgi:hypothetical protein
VLKLQELVYPPDVVLLCLSRSFLIPATHEKCRQLICRSHLAQHHGLLINPDQPPRRRTHHQARCALSDAHPKTIGQNSRDHGGTHPRDLFQTMTDGAEVCAPDALLTNCVARQPFQLAWGDTGRPADIDLTQLKETSGGGGPIPCYHQGDREQDQEQPAHKGQISDHRMEPFTRGASAALVAPDGTLSDCVRATAAAHAAAIANALGHDLLFHCCCSFSCSSSI